MAYIPNEGKLGHPYELTPKDHANIVAAYKNTIVLSNVAGICRRHKETIKRWLDKGSEDILAGKESLFATLYADVKEVLAELKLKHEQELLQGGNGWQAIAWYLERCAYADYGRESELIREIKEDFDKLKELWEKKDA